MCVCGSGFRVLGLAVHGLGFSGLGVRVHGSGVQGLYRIQGVSGLIRV